MTDFDPVTLARLRHLVPGVSADDYAAAVLALNASLGEGVLAKADLPKGTELRTRLAVQDTSLAFGAITRILTSIANTEEQRENLVFLLAKAIDDSLNLGAFYMAGRPEEDLPPPITAADIARRGGEERARRDEQAKKPVKERFAAICAELMRADCNRLAAELIRAAKQEYGGSRPTLPGDKQLSTWLAAAVASGAVPPPRPDGRSKSHTRNVGKSGA